MSHSFNSRKLSEKEISNFSYEIKLKGEYEFHISKEVRKKYEFGDELFSLSGNVVFANFNAVRVFAQKINAKRDKANHVRPGEINALGLIDEIYHFLIREYEKSENPGVMSRALSHLKEKLTDEQLNKLLYDFVNIFPPIDVYKGKVSAYDYFNSYTDGKSNIEITLEELMLLHFSNINPAGKKLKELFDENYLTDKKAFAKSIEELDKFFQKEKPFGPDNQPLFELLKTPFLQNPDDLEAQLDFIMKRWKVVVEAKFAKRILSSKDLMKEDITFENTGGGGGGAPSVAPKYKGKADMADILVLGKSSYKYAEDAAHDYDEPEAFTKDLNWMPSVVLMAKNIYVWLDQLSKQYNREIKTLDQIPDEELDRLARWNFNGLWLIGVWERSRASKRIKHIMGNIDAVSSAYSLYDYQIAHDLGGDSAYENLNYRAKIRGIRLASDMVPNHTGIFSKWVIEHPNYFVQSDYPPFPNYSFNGEDLSEDPSVQLRIEDGYYTHSDAAVVFQRIDNNSGEVKYLYHGNDGTNMPWNDTAQLNYMKKEVREAVIQKIFDVARKFSIIRFDAAMTLTKRHYSRLWFPQPGKGGDIPSRAEHSLTRQEFDDLFPEEFWREVVDRINKEMPDTLLLAEAFWLMEGYFVRSLGMHRVYNSAFMHMMMKEENDKYRDLITNTLEFEPEILKRYVSFMSNPDEETAIKQFGTDDKYFGVSTLLVTLPGLPMFGHGQVEGYTEKYGMEYQRAYYNETPKDWLVERHQQEIFPLMQKRYLFSQVDNFWLYDFFDGFGGVNENVFAYTNVHGNERALVIYNNKYEKTQGRIFQSAPKLVGAEKSLQSKTLAEALNIRSSNHHFYIYREQRSGLEYVASGRSFAFNGFETELNGFEYRVFIDFREVFDATGEYEKLVSRLNGKGVRDMEREFKEMKLHPVHDAFELLFEEEIVKEFADSMLPKSKDDDENEKAELKQLKIKFQLLLNTVRTHYNLDTKLKPITADYLKKIEAGIKLNEFISKNFDTKKNISYIKFPDALVISDKANYRENMLILMMIFTVSSLKEMVNDNEELRVEEFIDSLLLSTPVKKILGHLGRGESEIASEITLMNIILDQKENLFDLSKIKVEKKTNKEISNEMIWGKKASELIDLLDDEYVKAFIGLNYHKDVWYYSKEKFDELINWLFSMTLLGYQSDYMKEEPEEKTTKAKTDKRKTELVTLIKDTFDYYLHLRKISRESGYKIEALKVLINNDRVGVISESR